MHEEEREMQLLKMCVVAGLYVERERERVLLPKICGKREIGRDRDSATEDVCCCWTICGESERERERCSY